MHYMNAHVEIGPCALNIIVSFLSEYLNTFYKITKIVRALWLAERRVCMRVCKHGCVT